MERSTVGMRSKTALTHWILDSRSAADGRHQLGSVVLAFAEFYCTDGFETNNQSRITC